ncbi:hypothetical protein FB451DRAFT_1172697 [Mycena latifolia]|nr:hypothetical protein FB451DRAFT_1172697 [Mycena latifolia]
MVGVPQYIRVLGRPKPCGFKLTRSELTIASICGVRVLSGCKGANRKITPVFDTRLITSSGSSGPGSRCCSPPVLWSGGVETALRLRLEALGDSEHSYRLRRCFEGGGAGEYWDWEGGWACDIVDGTIRHLSCEPARLFVQGASLRPEWVPNRRLDSEAKDLAAALPLPQSAAANFVAVVECTLNAPPALTYPGIVSPSH